MEMSKLSVPGAIIIAGIIVGGAVMYSGQHPAVSQVAAPNLPTGPTYSLDKVRPISATDHIRGQVAGAKAVIVEYSDLECPFCKEFHKTVQQLMQDYDGKLAWVYRQFPLNIHPKAEKEAEASECVSELGGQDKFWQFVDKIFAITPSNNGLDPVLLTKTATELGIDEKAFTTCLDSGRYADKIKKDEDNGVAAGAQGTPFSVIILANGKKVAVPGAYPIDAVRQMIEGK